MGIGAFSQSVISRSWPISGFESVSIELPFAEDFQLSNHTENTVVMSYMSSGEYQDQMRIRSSVTADILQLTEFRNPFLNRPNDKLATHKVIATQMTLKIPHSLAVFLEMEEGKIQIQGQYQQLDVLVRSGVCLLDLTATPGQLKTLSAGIKITHREMTLTVQSNQKKIDCSIDSDKVLFEVVNLRGKVDCNPL